MVNSTPRCAFSPIIIPFLLFLILLIIESEEVIAEAMAFLLKLIRTATRRMRLCKIRDSGKDV